MSAPTRLASRDNSFMKPMRVASIALTAYLLSSALRTGSIGIHCLEGSNRHCAFYRDRLAKRLDALDFVHGLGREVRFAATRA